MSVKPKLVCPPDYSILSLRFTECKKIGVVKGVTTLLSYDLSNFFIPLTNYTEKRLVVKAGETRKLDINDIAVYWPLQEKYNFIADNSNRVDDLTTHTFTLYDEYFNLLSTISFQVDSTDPNFIDFPTAFKYVFNQNTVMSGYIAEPEFGPATSQFVVTAVAKDKKYIYLMQYDTGNPNGEYKHPGTLIQKSQKYPEGRVRAIFLYADYMKADASTCTCGCTDPSGELLSNVKNFKWAWDSDYVKKQYAALNTKIYVNASASIPSQQNGNGTQTFQWEEPTVLPYADRLPYNLEVGQLLTINDTANNPYAYVIDIDGYNITIDKSGMGSNPAYRNLIKKYAPTPIDWKTNGEMLFISGGQDVYDTDRLYTETIWINNTQNYDIPFTAIIVS
jgi:hypothetical protein